MAPASRKELLLLSLTVGLALHALPVLGQEIDPMKKVEFRGNIIEPDQLSGAAFYHDFLVLCPDEGATINVLKKTTNCDFELLESLQLADNDNELDLEGAATDGKYLYLVGSHSMRRKKLDAMLSYEENRSRLATTEPHSDSYCLFRLKLDETGRLLASKRKSLRDSLEGDDRAAPFIDIPGKENGIDIEGIAAKDGRLFIGFRGPVLRDGYVPVLSFEFATLESTELRFVRLGGRGIRDIVAVENGFLILAGPVAEGDGTYRVFLWNGKDCIPGSDSPNGVVEPLGQVTVQAAEKPEGLAVVAESASGWDCLLICDGSSIGQKIRVEMPD